MPIHSKTNKIRTEILSTKTTNNYRGISCLNCKHPLDISDKFCPNCGQKNTTKRLTIKDFIDEFLANFYAYDSKVKRTIISLFTKPGIAARDFISGKRMYYANPFRFYLSISLIYFIFIGLINKFGEDTIIDLDQNSIKNEVELDSIQANRNQFTIGTPESPIQINNKGYVSETKDTTKIILYTEKQLSKYNFFKRTFFKIETYADFFDTSKETYPPKILDTLKHENNRWNRFLLKKTYQLSTIAQEESSGKIGINTFSDYLEGKTPFILFVSLPFLTIVFALIYYRKKLYYAEHMVLVFSIMSFVFLLLFLTEIINLLTSFDLRPLLFFVMIYYIYKSLRNFYQQSRLKTILKFVILSILLPITATFVALAVLFIGFLLY